MAALIPPRNDVWRRAVLSQPNFTALLLNGLRHDEARFIAFNEPFFTSFAQKVEPRSCQLLIILPH